MLHSDDYSDLGENLLKLHLILISWFLCTLIMTDSLLLVTGILDLGYSTAALQGNNPVFLRYSPAHALYHLFLHPRHGTQVQVSGRGEWGPQVCIYNPDGRLKKKRDNDSTITAFCNESGKWNPEACDNCFPLNRRCIFLEMTSSDPLWDF